MAGPKRCFIVHFRIFLFLSVATHLAAAAQERDTLAVNRKRLNTFIAGSAAGYGATLFGLHQLWYRNSAQQSFRFFNDNAEWKQVDKLGHFYSAFYFSYGTSG